MSIGQLRTRPGYAAALAAMAAVLAVALIGWFNAIARLGGPFDILPGLPLIDVVHDVGGGLTFATVGFTVWWRRPRNLAGPLMVIIAVALLAPIFEWVPAPPLVTLAQVSWGSPPVLIGALLLLYPTGRVGSRAEIAWLMGAAGLLLVGLLHAIVTPIGIWSCSDCRSWIVLSYDERISNDMWLVKVQGLAVLAIALAGLLIGRWLRASGPTRRVMSPLWVSGVAFIAVVLAIVVLDTSGFTPGVFARLVPNFISELRLQIPTYVRTAIPYVATTALFLIPLALGWGQVRWRWGQVAVSGLAIELSRADGRQPLVDSLRHALGDPGLALALWSRPARAYVTPEGVPIRLPEDESHGVTHLSADDGPLAAIIHDPALTEQRRLIDGVAAVAQLAIENERLHAEVKAQLDEVRASRQRIVGAADEERRRVERNLHDGAQQRLVSLAMALRLARAEAVDASPAVADRLADAEIELRQAVGELRELARGIHPPILTEAGLGAALQSLGEHAPLPVAVEAHLNGRLTPVVEATAYFVVAEALTNVVKHASATAATVRAGVSDGTLRIRVADNGQGGADPDLGTGLRGLTDRVAALGGSLRISDDPEGGTALEAEIPCR